MKTIVYFALFICALGLGGHAWAEQLDGLKLHYTFDKVERNIAEDVSGHGHAGQIIHAVQVKSGSTHALKFNGTNNSYVAVRNSKDLSLTGEITFMAWIKLELDPTDKTPTNWTVFDCEVYKQYGFLLRVDGAKQTLYYRSSQGGVYQEGESKAPLKNNTYYHIALIKQGQQVRLFINGQPDAQFEAKDPVAPEKPLYISSNQQSFRGLIGDVQVYDRALDLAEVANDFEQTSGGYLSAEESAVVVEGDRLVLKFSADDFHLQSMSGVNDQSNIVASFQTAGNALWQMDFRTRQGRRGSKRIILDATVESEKNHQVERNAQGVTCRLFWKNIDLDEERDVLDVTAIIHIPADSDRAQWTLRVDNRSEHFGVWEYSYPRIEVAPLDANMEANFFVNTDNLGQVVADPFHVKPNAEGETLYDWHKRLGRYPAGQFMALYGANGRGFYFSAQDAGGWMKIIESFFYPQMPAVRFSMVHHTSPVALAGDDFVMPYPVVAGLFQGDWYDACQIYREWAIQQPWCAKGTIAERDDIPDWLKNTSMVVKLDTSRDSLAPPDRDTPPNSSHLYDNTQNYLRCLELFGRDITALWYSWWIRDLDHSATSQAYLQGGVNGRDGQLVEAIPGIAQANRQIVEAGGYPMAYFNAYLYDPGVSQDAQLAEPFTIRDVNDELSMRYKYFYSMCPQASWWQERYADVARYAIKDLGFKGIYIDSFGKPWGQCFGQGHGHDFGGTRDYRGERAFGQHIRQAIKAEDSQAIISGENCSEAFIDIVDTRLSSTILQEHIAPIFPAVYHDYQLFYGRVINPDRGARLLRMSAGYTFVFGGQLGRYTISNLTVNWDKPEHEETLAFFHSLVTAKRSARSFLNLGQMLRPPKITRDVPTVTQKVWYEGQHVSLPTVLCSAWKSTDGRVAIVFLNWETSPIDLVYQIDTVEYGFAEGAFVNRHRLGPEGGEEPLEPVKSGVLKLSESLPAGGICIVVLDGGL